MLRFLRHILLPISLLYGLIMACRNILFNFGIFKSESYKTPVLSIGNITVGGTGKTPHSEYIISLLKDDYKIAILSRGYGRKTKGFRYVEADNNPENCGDEPCQIKHKFPSIIVAVDEDRRHGISTLIKEHNPDLILLDDAYQHRWVKPGFSILLIDYVRPIFKDFMMPTGNLREFPQGKKRANIIIITKCPTDISDIEKEKFTQKLKLNKNQRIYFSSFSYGDAKPVFSTEIENNFCLKDKNILLLSGIANPLPLKKYLEVQGAVVKMLNFADHHQFTNNDIAKITTQYELFSKDNSCIITTEKDSVRLKDGLDIPAELRQQLYFIPIKVQILANEVEFNQLIKDYVGKN